MESSSPCQEDSLVLVSTLFHGNTSIYEAFFDQYQITKKEINDNFESKSNKELIRHFSKGFDEFVANEFEARIYAELNNEEREWYFNGFTELFIAQFRSSCEIFNPKSKPSENLNAICWFDIEGHTKVEILYFFRKYQQWIVWQKQTNFPYYVVSKWVDKLSTKELGDSLGKLYYLIDMFITYYSQKYDATRSIDKQSIEKADANRSLPTPEHNSSKYQQVLEMVNFLNEKDYKTKKRYMSEEDFKTFTEYLRRLVFDGDITITKSNPTYSISILNKRDIVYTFYIINKLLYKNKRNQSIFKILSFCDTAYTDLKDVIKDRQLKNHTTYKDFAKYTEDYVNHNPKYFNLS